MYSGKSEWLIRQARAAEAVGEVVLFVKPAVDNRFGPTEARSRSGSWHEAVAVTNSMEIAELYERSVEKPHLVAIDEVQFFDPKIVEVVLYLAEECGCQTAYSGLNTDFRGNPFGPIQGLMAVSTDLNIMTARCTAHVNNGDKRKCGARAHYTQRLINGQPAPYESEIIVIDHLGKTEVTYEARCADHWSVPGMPKRLVKG